MLGQIAHDAANIGLSDIHDINASYVSLPPLQRPRRGVIPAAKMTVFTDQIGLTIHIQRLVHLTARQSCGFNSSLADLQQYFINSTRNRETWQPIPQDLVAQPSGSMTFSLVGNVSVGGASGKYKVRGAVPPGQKSAFYCVERTCLCGCLSTKSILCDQLVTSNGA